jgi:hypothetical protein
MCRRTLGEMVYGQFPMRILSQVFECYFRLALPYHEMYNDQALEDNSPCRVAQAVRKGAKDLSDACLAGVSGYEDVLDILGFGCGELCVRLSMSPWMDEVQRSESFVMLHRSA